jgi:hypothetical protein
MLLIVAAHGLHARRACSQDMCMDMQRRRSLEQWIVLELCFLIRPRP